MNPEEIPKIEQQENLQAEEILVEKPLKNILPKEAPLSRNEKIRELKNEIEDIEIKRNQAQVLRDGYGVPHESLTDDVQAALVAPLEEKHVALQNLIKEKQINNKTIFQKAVAVLAFITAGSIFGDKVVKEKQKEEIPIATSTQFVKK